MLTVENVHTAPRERLLVGANNWWFLGPGGIAKVLPAHLDADGGLLRTAEAHLRGAGMYDVKPYSVYSLTVLTSTDCNLGCGYCFQNTSQDLTGGNRPPRISHSRLTSETIDRILDFTGRRMAEANLQRLGIMLFGGEPLLNLRGCKELLARAADYGMKRAQMISNGVLLTPLVARELSDRGLRSIQITFDGDQAEHDQIRVRRSGGGTFEAIVNNIARCSEVSSLRWELRVNVSHHTRDGVPALIQRLAERLDPSRCSLYFIRVGDTGVGYENELLHSGELAADFSAWNRQSMQAGFGVPAPRAKMACQACSHKDGRFGAVVNADGTLYSCWETSGKPEWQVGSVAEGYLPDAQTDERWVGCGYEFQFSDEQSALEKFADTVDAALLDDLSAAGRL
ncbi:MAG: radical SAM protein [Actinomycetota bacterium]|nr:radical SAM protein [Actinomycetota bacterium]MDQ2959288.1 radical SAM protein [Actinomycetota bacterium]